MTQIRRLQSLRRRIKKLQSYDEVWERTWQTLWEEWSAITQYVHNEQKFPVWTQHIPELFPYPAQLPTEEWLYDAEQILKHELNHQLYQEDKIRQNKQKMQHIIDCQDGSKRRAFAAVCKNTTPPLSQLQREETAVAIVVPLDGLTTI